MCALVAVRHRADVGVVGEVGARRVDVACGVLRVGNDGALRHRFDGGGLVRRKAVEEARLAVIRAAAQDIAVLGRVAAEPFHLSGIGGGIEPRAHIAVAPVVGAVFAPVAATAVGAAGGILAGLRVIGHRVAQHLVREHQRAIFVHADAAPQNRLAVVAAQLNVIAELNARLRARGLDRQREQAERQDSGKKQSRHSAASLVLHVLSPLRLICMVLPLKLSFYRKRQKNTRKNSQFPVRSHARLPLEAWASAALCGGSHDPPAPCFIRAPVRRALPQHDSNGTSHNVPLRLSHSCHLP